MPRGFAPPNNPPDRAHTAGGRAAYREMRGHVSPRFRLLPHPLSPRLAASCRCCCRCCCRRVHTATPYDLKSPFRYARRGCPRLYSHRGASAAAVLPTVRRDTTLPACSCAFTIGKFRRWWYSSPPCSTFGEWRLISAGLLFCPRSVLVFISTSSSRARPCSNILGHEAALEPTLRVL